MNIKQVDYTSLLVGIVGLVIEIFIMFAKLIPFLIYCSPLYARHIFVMFIGIVALAFGEVFSICKSKIKNTIIGIILNSMGLIISIFNLIIFIVIINLNN